MKLQNFLLVGLMICSFGAKADVRYAGVSFQSGDIDLDSDSFDVSAYGVNFLSTSGNILFSTSAASGTVDDFYGYDLDFAAQGINLGYAFGDLKTGSFVFGASYSRGEIQNPGRSNVKTSETDPFVGFAKMSGEGTDYRITISDGVLSAKGIFQIGASDGWKATLGFANADNTDSVSIGMVLQF